MFRASDGNNSKIDDDANTGFIVLYGIVCEFVVRLINSGVKRKNVRFNAIQFHLWHKENSRMSLKRNDTMLDDAINNRIHWCENGINSIEKNES